MRPKYVLRRLDRDSSAQVLHGFSWTLDAALLRARRDVSLSRFSGVEVREMHGDEVFARWRIDSSGKLVSYSERAEIERRIEGMESDLRRRRAMLRTIDAVIDALRSIGIGEAQCDPDKPNGLSDTSWTWYGGSMRAGLYVVHYSATAGERAPVDEVKWEIVTWDVNRSFSGKTQSGLVRLVGDSVAFPEEFIAAIRKCKRSL